MLQAIRSKADTYVVKVLFALLTATFALWGIGDIFRNWDTDTSVAKVGSMQVTADQLSKQVRAEIDQLRTALGNDIDTEQAKQLGIVDTALQHIVGADLIDLESQRLDLRIGDDAVRASILGDPNFKDAKGNFDRDRYSGLLAANQLNDSQYETSVRSGMIQNQLTRAIADGMTAPATLTDAFYRARAERRSADVVTLASTAVPAAPTPSSDQLAAYYEAHKDAFRSPELRAITIATLKIDDIAAGINVSNDKLKQQYDARKDEFQTPEQRKIEQMLLPDEAKAKEAEAQLATGQDFAAVAKTEANEDQASIDLGWVKQGDLPGQLADAAFSLPKGKSSDPVQTSFGWHILRVADIKPPQVQTIDAVKDQLTREIQRDQAGDAIAKTANDVDDAMAGGASFASVVQKFGLKTQTIPAVDAQGRNPDGKPMNLPQPTDAVLQAAFSTAAGQTSPLSELGEDGYFLVSVDKITPAAARPLADARADVIAAWQADQKKDALDKLAASIIQDVDAGKNLKDVAAARKLAVTSTPALARTANDPTLPPAALAALFTAKQGGAVSAAAGDGVVVAQLKAIEPADPASDPAGTKQVSDLLGSQLQNDMIDAFDKSLRSVFPVEINQANLDHAL